MDPTSALPPATDTALRPAVRPQRERRLRIWELPRSCHCVVVGTCLTIADLRRTARRLGLFEHVDAMSDHELHGAYVHAMATRNRASAAVQKLLEAAHAGAIRKAARCRGEAALAAFWDAEVAEGQIAGAFWAVMSHEGLDAGLEARAFGEVHMMSHLCGASLRADIRARAIVERQLDATVRRLDQLAVAQREAIAERDREIDRLKRLVVSLEPAVVEARRLRVAVETLSSEAALADRDARIAALERALATADLRRAAQDDELAAARDRERELVRRGRLLEDALAAADIGPVDADDEAAGACPFSLDGRCIAYIGGRPHAVSRMRSLVERCRGAFVHHDGGPEQSSEALDGVLSRADVVMFPVDCVSHAAVDRLKTICTRRNKTFLPLSSSSYSSFASGLGRLS